jgi:hypothetical protein
VVREALCHLWAFGANGKDAINDIEQLTISRGIMIEEFKLVHRNDIEWALKEYDQINEDERAQYGKQSISHFIDYNDQLYPTKRIFRLAYHHVTGREMKTRIRTHDYDNYYRGLGFKIVNEKGP